MLTPGWLSEYVVKVWDVLHGMRPLRSTKWVITPPAVSIPSDSGVTSTSKTSWTLASSTPESIAACTAAPYATASSGLMDLFKSLPLMKSDRSFWIFGILVDPPTNTTSWMLLLSILASRKAFSTGSIVALNKSPHSSSNLALVMVE